MSNSCAWLIPGSGRVTFNNHRSYLKAVTAAFVEIKTTKFTKKVSGTGEAAHGRGLCHGWYCWELQCSWALPHSPAQAAQSGAATLSALGVDLRYSGRGQSAWHSMQSAWCSMPTASFSCRFKLTRTWRIPCAKCAMPSLAHSSAEIR